MHRPSQLLGHLRLLLSNPDLCRPRPARENWVLQKPTLDANLAYLERRPNREDRKPARRHGPVPNHLERHGTIHLRIAVPNSLYRNQNERSLHLRVHRGPTERPVLRLQNRWIWIKTLRRPAASSMSRGNHWSKFKQNQLSLIRSNRLN